MEAGVLPLMVRQHLTMRFAPLLPTPAMVKRAAYGAPRRYPLDVL